MAATAENELTGFEPVFIIGCPRSGTTMLASQLGAAPGCVVLPEMHYVSWLLEAEVSEPVNARALYQRLLADFSFRALRMDYQYQDFARSLQSADRRERVFSIIRVWLSKQGRAASASHWIEHSPINRERVLRLMRLFPDAKFIHIVRDPRAVYVSMNQMAMWNTHDPLRLAKFWSNAVSRCALHAADFPLQIAEVRYEDYVADPAQQLLRLADFVGVQMNETMLFGGAVPLPKFTQKQHALTTGPAVKDKTSEWKVRIKPREAEVIAAFCHPWMTHYAYLSADEFFRDASRKERQYFQLRQILKTPFSKVARLIQQRA